MARGKKEASIAEAEGVAKSIELKAKAQSEANALLTTSLSPPLLQYETLQKWDGKLPVYNDSGAVPFINLNN